MHVNGSNARERNNHTAYNVHTDTIANLYKCTRHVLHTIVRLLTPVNLCTTAGAHDKSANDNTNITFFAHVIHEGKRSSTVTLLLLVFKWDMKHIEALAELHRF